MAAGDRRSGYEEQADGTWLCRGCEVTFPDDHRPDCVVATMEASIGRLVVEWRETLDMLRADHGRQLGKVTEERDASIERERIAGLQLAELHAQARHS